MKFLRAAIATLVIHERTLRLLFLVLPNVRQCARVRVYQRAWLQFQFQFRSRPPWFHIPYVSGGRELPTSVYCFRKRMEIIRARRLDGPRERELANKGWNGTDMRWADRAWASWISSWAAAVSISYRNHDTSDRYFFLFSFPFCSPVYPVLSLSLSLSLSFSLCPSLVYFSSHRAR